MLNLTPERFEALKEFRRAADRMLAPCASEAELRTAERLLCTEACIRAEEARRALARADSDAEGSGEEGRVEGSSEKGECGFSVAAD